MVGLGALAHDPADADRYLLFSPKIVGLLGGPDKIMATLADTTNLSTADRFSAKDERRLVDADAGVFSPLTELVLSQLTAPRNRFTIIAGTAELGLDQVHRTLKHVADAQYGAPSFGVTSTPAQRPKVAARLAEANPRLHRIHVVDLANAGRGVVDDIIDLARAHTTIRDPDHGTLRVVVLAGPRQSQLWHRMLASPAAVPAELVVLRRFDADALRLWRRLHDIPSDDASFLTHTLAATSGWPKLLAIAWQQWQATGQWTTALEAARAGWDDPAVAAGLLSAAGLDDADSDTVNVYRQLLEYHGADDVGFDDLAAVCDHVDDARPRLVDLHVSGAIDLTDRTLRIEPVLRTLHDRLLTTA